MFVETVVPLHIEVLVCQVIAVGQKGVRKLSFMGKFVDESIELLLNMLLICAASN